jgi:pyruvate dehydrogenase E2 component (dihydrolipoamide acetyltransferase)
MVESCRTTAPVTLTATADATNLVNLRGQFQAVAPEGGDVPGYTDFVVKLTAMALRDHPMLNARWDEDRLMIPDEPQIGISVDTEEGLLVPVIRGAAGLALGRIAELTRDLVRRARERRIRSDEMQGGTFTITNLGAFGIETFTPIINPPECAVLGVGRIAREPVMRGDQVVARERMGLSLTFDHRIVDGAPAARFLQTLVRLIENPGPALIA